MGDFKTAFGLTSDIEGLYCNVAADAGGETYRGIARNIYPNWPGWASVDEVKKTATTDAEINAALASVPEMQQMVEEFFKKTFWDVHTLDQMQSQEIANKVYDCAVNCGNGTSAKFLQRTLNFLNRNNKDWEDVVVDGNVGPRTIATANKASAIKGRGQNIVLYLNVLQGYRYVELAERPDRYGATFINGWALRVRIPPRNS